MDIFPYSYRTEQKELTDFIAKAAADRRCAVIESGTGTGKTICSLVGTIQGKLYHGYKILYLTRTRSQQKQVMSELREINKKFKIFGTAIQGRSVATCPMMLDDIELQSGTPDELSRWCSEYKRKKGKEDGCPYYNRIEEVNLEMMLHSLRTNQPDPESFQKYCIEKGICPYEMSKLILPYAEVICTPYSFLLTPMARRAFLEWIGVPLNELVVVIDEAHNVPSYLRDVVTSEYTERALDLAEKEMVANGNPEISEGIKATSFVSAMRHCFDNALKEYLIDEDGLIPPYFLEEELMSFLTISSVTLNKMCKNLIDLGEEVIEKKRKMKKLPRSYMKSLGSFVQFWYTCDESHYVKLINGGTNPSFEAYCMDPYFAAEPLRECRASIHMSGTLEPLEEYAQELGLTNPMVRSFVSPFDPSNLLSLYTDDVTTKHEDLVSDPEMFSKIEENVVKIANAVKRNTIVFFPSYKMIDQFVNDGIPERLGREVYCEKPGMSQIELMDTVDTFRFSDGNILFAVCGGKISEGLDFPSKDLELAIIIGIPYPYPTLKQGALVRYCDLRFGKGWDHAVKSPTVRKMRQARGRLIRSETDRGVCVVLDKRVATLTGYDAELSVDPVSDIRKFFGE